MAKRVILDVQTGEVREEEFEFVPPPPVPEPPNQDEELAKAIESATTLEELKQALLSKLRPARVEGRP